ncbi:hypothetical protein [Povalibacter sp.]|uniref:hypothetical protein n=1 Tax=Povalibacter sp. TaxID=1962978 RepID=UPI003BEED1A6
MQLDAIYMGEVWRQRSGGIARGIASQSRQGSRAELGVDDGLRFELTGRSECQAQLPVDGSPRHSFGGCRSRHDPYRCVPGADHLSRADLAAFARFRLTVHLHVAVSNHCFRLAAAAGDTSGFQQRIEWDELTFQFEIHVAHFLRLYGRGASRSASGDDE